MAPVRLAIARCARWGSLPASQAITASTANSGRVCSQARIARASPWDIRNCAASAPHATRKAESSMLGKVHSADSAEAPACETAASSFRNRTGRRYLQASGCGRRSVFTSTSTGALVMGRDQIKSASLHSFHEDHVEPQDAGRFEQLVHEML